MKNISERIQQYFDLATQPDSDAYFAQFTPSAIVEDEGHEHHGVDAIRAWRTRVPRVTYTVQDLEPSETGAVTKVNISGDFPGSPVVLTFHFSFVADGRIEALAIR
jgi:SnoaL-like domain